MSKATKRPTPNKLSKTGKKAGIELTESQLSRASGGVTSPTGPIQRPKIKVES